VEWRSPIVDYRFELPPLAHSALVSRLERASFGETNDED